jgi:ADP-heptose:LPS heptosyltransferase
VRRELRADHFDAALDLQGNWKSALVTRLARARERFGMAATWRQEPLSRVLLRRVIRCDAVPHPARAAWELVRALAPDAPFLHPRLVPHDAEVARERRMLADVGVDLQRPFTVVVVTDPADPRALRTDFVRREVARVAQPVALLGPDEADLATALTCPVVRHEAGAVRRLVALGAIAAAAGGAVIGPDQGATHVLLAAGAPGQVVFGSQDPQRTAPPSACNLVRADAPACQPCRQRRCRHPEGVVCMAFDARDGRKVESGLPPPGTVAGARPR